MKTLQEILKKHLLSGNPHSRQDDLGSSIEDYVFLPHIIGAMQEYASQYKEWISVDTRLPEEGTTVLCYGVGGRFFTSVYGKVGSMKEPRFLCYDEDDYDIEIASLTHWQPLKAPLNQNK